MLLYNAQHTTVLALCSGGDLRPRSSGSDLRSSFAFCFGLRVESLDSSPWSQLQHTSRVQYSPVYFHE